MCFTVGPSVITVTPRNQFIDSIRDCRLFSEIDRLTRDEKYTRLCLLEMVVFVARDSLRMDAASHFLCMSGAGSRCGRVSHGRHVVGSNGERYVCQNRRSRSRGFSLIEMLVATAIVALLAALILPAVQSSRAAARRTACLNNLRQLGLALHAYHELHHLFPPGVIWGGPPGEPQGMGQLPIGLIDRVALGTATPTDLDRVQANWLVMLLPNLDQGALWNAFDSSHPISHLKNEIVRTTSVPLLMCPEDGFNRDFYVRDQLSGGSTNLYARGNYALNLGPGRGCVHELEAGCQDGFHVDDPDLLTKNSVLWGGGAAGVNRSFGVKDLLGGASNFVIVDEIRAGVHPLDPRGSWALGFVGASMTVRHGMIHGREDAGGPNNQNRSSDDIVGCVDMIAQIGQGALQSLRMPCRDQRTIGEPQLNSQATARSQHDGGVHVLAADGAAHFISDTVNPDIWFSLHSREPGSSFESPF